MPHLVFRTSPDAGNVDRATIYGAYLLQSERDPTQFRVGIAGQRNMGTFWERLNRTHRSRPCDDNWTTARRPWKALWTLEIAGGTAIAVIMVEHLLYTVLGSHHVFDSDSGFTAAADEAEAIVARLKACTDDIVALVEAQLRMGVTVERETTDDRSCRSDFAHTA